MTNHYWGLPVCMHDLMKSPAPATETLGFQKPWIWEGKGCSQTRGHPVAKTDLGSRPHVCTAHGHRELWAPSSSAWRLATRVTPRGRPQASLLFSSSRAWAHSFWRETLEKQTRLREGWPQGGNDGGLLPSLLLGWSPCCHFPSGMHNLGIPSNFPGRYFSRRLLLPRKMGLPGMFPTFLFYLASIKVVEMPARLQDFWRVRDKRRCVISSSLHCLLGPHGISHWPAPELCKWGGSILLKSLQHSNDARGPWRRTESMAYSHPRLGQ